MISLPTHEEIENLKDHEIIPTMVQLSTLLTLLNTRMVQNGKDTLTLPPKKAKEPTEEMTVKEVAEVLKVSKRYVYNHAPKWTFTRKVSRKCLRFDKKGFYRWVESRGLSVVQPQKLSS